MTHPRLSRIALVLFVVVGLAASPTASASTSWAAAADATIHPGVRTYSSVGQCTANFVFTDRSGGVYLGTANHCVDGVGSAVTVEGATHLGVVAYASGSAQRAANDFALIRLDAADRSRVNPSVPYWGGPTGLAPAPTPNELTYSYGSSGLRPSSALSPKVGVVHETRGTIHHVNTVTPGIPGDSGSAYLDQRGAALGVLSTIAVGVAIGGESIGGVPVHNELTDLAAALQSMRARGGPDVTLAVGTEPFRGALG